MTNLILSLFRHTDRVNLCSQSPSRRMRNIFNRSRGQEQPTHIRVNTAKHPESPDAYIRSYMYPQVLNQGIMSFNPIVHRYANQVILGNRP